MVNTVKEEEDDEKQYDYSFARIIIYITIQLMARPMAANARIDRKSAWTRDWEIAELQKS